MKYPAGTRRLSTLRTRIGVLREKMRAVQATIEPQPVGDYAFQSVHGEVRLSELFGAHTDLFVVHNMGAHCAYCTLWADGYNGVYSHLASRAAFVVSSPDSPAVQARFARSRRWRFRMVSTRGTSFADDMGYRTPSGNHRPGISVFQKTRKGVVRVSDAASCPHDDFSAVWHLFDLLPHGVAGWHPRFRYAGEPPSRK